MRIPTGSLFLLAALGLVRPDPSLAQNIPSPYRYVEPAQEAGAWAGWFGAGTGRYGFGPGPGPALGGRYAVELSGPIALEGILTFVPTNRDVVDPARPGGSRVVGESATKLLRGEARLRFTLTGRRTWHNLSPHLLLGGGVGMDVEGVQREDLLVEERDRYEFGTKFLGSFGAGVRWHVSGPWVVRSDAVLTLYKLDTPGGFSDADRNLENVPASEWVNTSVLSIGLSRLF